VEATARYLTFADEAPLGGRFEGDTSFARDFTARGPFHEVSGKPRTLREFELRERLFVHPLSYLVYTSALDGLEPVVLRHLLQRLRQVLLEEAGDGEFARLDAKRAKDAWEIFAATRCFAALPSDTAAGLGLKPCRPRN
jgi:hypothetical protein